MLFRSTGLVVRATELLGVFDRVVRDDAKRCQYHYVLIDFLCERIDGDLRAAGDAADARWFTLEEMSKLPLPEDTAAVIRMGLEKAAR